MAYVVNTIFLLKYYSEKIIKNIKSPRHYYKKPLSFLIGIVQITNDEENGVESLRPRVITNAFKHASTKIWTTTRTGNETISTF